jgi:hypothetical protein
MKKITSLIFMLAFIVSIANAQKITVDYDYDLETSKVMFDILGMKSYKFQIPKDFQQKRFRIITKEYYEGEMLSVDSGVILDEISEDATTLTFIGYKLSDTIEKANFYMPPNVLMTGPYQLKFDRLKYDWATLIDEQTIIESNIEIPFLTYTYQPIFKNMPNFAVFCQLPNFVDKYQSWHKMLNVKHFFIFILRFEE